MQLQSLYFFMMDQDKRLFVEVELASVLKTLADNTAAKWGKMNAQQMLEHLQGFFEVSTEKKIYPLVTPEEQLPLFKEFLYSDKKRVGYITGGELYNQLNLTTQNYFRTKIATNRSRKKIEKGWLKTSTVKSYVDITDENYQLLGILDAIKDIRNIADTSTAQAIKILGGKMGEFDKKAIQSLIEYALQYPPRVRALLGAIVEDRFGNKFNLEPLRNSLNPST